MTDNSKIGMALVGGYLLGRTKKAKLAIGLGMALAGKKLNINPQQLARMVANSPVVGQLSDQVRKDLFDNTKSALTSAVTKRAGSLADSLHERTLDMNDPTRRARRAEAAEDGAERAEAGRDEAGERDGRDEHEEREARPRPRKSTSAGGTAARTAKPTGSAASSNGKAASGRRTGGSGAGARKSASSGARKTAGGARKTTGGARKTTGGARKTAAKTASGGARKAANRGGGNG